MGLRNAYDFVLSEIGLDRPILSSLPDYIGFIGFLPVHAEAIFVRVDGDSLEGELVGGAEDTDGYFATIGDEELLLAHDGTGRTETVVNGRGGRLPSTLSRRHGAIMRTER